MRAIAMKRWVQVEGRRVTFGNVLGGFRGRPYEYQCRSAKKAAAFKTFLEQRDPGNSNRPVAVTPEVQKRFGARLLKQTEIIEHVEAAGLGT